MGVIRQEEGSCTLHRRANVRNEAHEKRVWGGIFEGEGVGVGGAIGKTAKLLRIVEGRGNGDIKNAAPVSAQKYKVSRVRGIP